LVELDESQHGQGLNNIAQRTWFEDEDFQGSKTENGKRRNGQDRNLGFYASPFTPHFPSASRSASRWGSPASMIFFCALGMS
jgi:hypothetical protein